MFWEKTLEANRFESLVDFRLRGNFGCSVLELRHTGMCSFVEFDWQLNLWHNSREVGFVTKVNVTAVAGFCASEMPVGGYSQ